jgi:photosystem II oxygen-evolving enhancer protein 3
MKIVAALAFATTVSAFAPQANNARQSVAMQAENSRREALSTIAAAGAVFLPAAANAAAGESPRFSVFGLIGDGTSYSEGAAYGSDQSSPLYSPYSVYGAVGGKDAIYSEGDASYAARKKAYIAESQKRLSFLPGYVEKNVKDELTRYMYETRGAVRGLAKTAEQKKIAKDFFQAIEEASLQATLKNQDKCAAASAASAKLLDQFVATL